MFFALVKVFSKITKSIEEELLYMIFGIFDRICQLHKLDYGVQDRFFFTMSALQILGKLYAKSYSKCKEIQP